MFKLYDFHACNNCIAYTFRNTAVKSLSGRLVRDGEFNGQRSICSLVTIPNQIQLSESNYDSVKTKAFMSTITLNKIK